MQYFATACAPQVRQLARQFQNAATEFPLVVDWSLDYGVDDDSGRSRQWLRSRLCTVHLEDVCGDVHCGVVIYVLELEARIVDRYLKTIYELPPCVHATNKCGISRKCFRRICGPPQPELK